MSVDLSSCTHFFFFFSSLLPLPLQGGMGSDGGMGGFGDSGFGGSGGDDWSTNSFDFSGGGGGGLNRSAALDPLFDLIKI
jgi:hypothetical protein